MPAHDAQLFGAFLLVSACRTSLSSWSQRPQASSRTILDDITLRTCAYQAHSESPLRTCRGGQARRGRNNAV